MPVLRALILAALVTATPLPAAEPQPQAPAAELVAARLAETRRLLATLDGLIQDLETFAQRQLELADMSEDFDQAARYEALYGETLLRVEQLWAQRQQLQTALETLEQRARELNRAQP